MGSSDEHFGKIMAKSRKILLMWSGGVTSTGILFKLLSDPQYSIYDIVVHHCHIRTGDNVAVAEATACSKIIDYVSDKKKYRKFYFSESNHEMSFMKSERYVKPLNYLDTIALVAAQMCASAGDVKMVMFGGSKTDVDFNINYLSVVKRSQRIFLEGMSLDHDTVDMSVEYPYFEATMRDVIDSLPRGFSKIVSSCLAPVEKDEQINACGECEKCLKRKKIR